MPISSEQWKLPSELNASSLVRTFNELRVVSAKYVPHHDAGSGVTISRPSGFHIDKSTRPEDIPIGDYPALRHQPSRELYLQSGQFIVQIMREMLAADCFQFKAGQRVLDFGCHSGRLLRWFLDEARNGVECWGVDIDAAVIDWISGRMAPPFHFAVTTTEPHLPFPDHYFDFIFAGSVFTHMVDLTEAWLLELKRVLQAGGRLSATFNDLSSVRLLEEKWPGSYDHIKFQECARQAAVGLDQLNFVCIDQAPYASIFYNDEYLKGRLSRLFRVKGVHPEAFGWQTGYLLQNA